MCPTVSSKPSEKGERKMNREGLERIVREERAAGNRPNLVGMDLSGAKLYGIDLWNVDLSGADLSGAVLTGAHLSQAELNSTKLVGADLRQADLRHADLKYADLRNADLSYADMRSANLSAAHLHRANLNEAHLFYADIAKADFECLVISRLPSGTLNLVPTPEGWHIHLGCWDGTVSELREMIAGDDDWPEAEGSEVEYRRPYIEAALALCELHMKDNNEAIDALAEKWLGERAKEGDE